MYKYWHIPFAAGSIRGRGRQAQRNGSAHKAKEKSPWVSPAGATRNVVRRLLLPLGMSLSMLAACSDTPKLPQPPLTFPFDTQKAGFKIETDIRVVDFNSYKFGFMLGFKEGDAADRERVKKLAGEYGRDKAGKLIQPGVPIPLRIRIEALKPSALEGVFEKEFLEQEMYAFGDSYYRTGIASVKLKPGTYHLAIENLKVVPELRGTSVILFVGANPKSTTYSD